MPQVVFTVNCKAEPQGSKRAFVVPGKNGSKARAVVVDNNKDVMRSYRSALRVEAMIAMQAQEIPQPMAEKHIPVELTVEFMFIRPASAKKRYWPVVLPDIDKILRSSIDAMIGVLFVDDAQVVKVSMEKVYGPTEQVHVSARTMEALPF